MSEEHGWTPVRNDDGEIIGWYFCPYIPLDLYEKTKNEA